MTRYAWVFNLDADFELTRPSYSTTDLLRDQLARHREAAAAMLMAPNDVIASPGACRGFVGRAWCPTPRALTVLKASGAEPEPHPSRDILRQVNHRRFAHQLGGGLPGQRYVESGSALTEVLRDTSHPWLLKRPLAFAGRGQSRVSGVITAKQEAWMAASLRDDGLIVEPLVMPTFEVSLHGYISGAGFELGKVCTQEVTALGVFLSARLIKEDELSAAERAALAASAERVAGALIGAGYFGPFGIDAYRYDSPLGSGFCALGEINARYTLAFAHGFGKRDL